MKDAGKSRTPWLGYGAELLTVFFAIAVLAGRVYAQSYWNVFGLSPELIDTTFINYAIMSPNTAVASVLMAMSTVVIIELLRRQLPDLVGDNPKVTYYIGFFVWWAGLSVVAIIMRVNTSAWTSGTAGLAFGLGYLSFIGGCLIWMQAGLKLENKDRPKWEIAIIQWLKNIPFALVQIFIIIGFAATSIWAVADTAQKFGANEAKMMHDMRPVATLQLDSPKGFEDLPLFSSPSGAVLLKARIIAEAGDFFYISINVTPTPPQLHVRAVPVSRVQAIQYAVGVSPLGR